MRPDHRSARPATQTTPALLRLSEQAMLSENTL